MRAGTDAAEDSAGGADGAEAAAAGEGRAERGAGGVRGDQIVEVKVVVPKVQDERSKEILRELAKLNPEDPRDAMFAEV